MRGEVRGIRALEWRYQGFSLRSSVLVGEVVYWERRRLLPSPDYMLDNLRIPSPPDVLR